MTHPIIGAQVTDYTWVNFKFKIYLSRFGGSPIYSAIPSYPLPPEITKQAIQKLVPTAHIWQLQPFKGRY